MTGTVDRPAPSPVWPVDLSIVALRVVKDGRSTLVDTIVRKRPLRRYR